MKGTYIDINGKEIGVLQRRWQWRWCGCGFKDIAGKARARGLWHGARPAQAKQGQCNDGVSKVVMEERENG
jgi:hypothetical protein